MQMKSGVGAVLLLGLVWGACTEAAPTDDDTGGGGNELSVTMDSDGDGVVDFVEGRGDADMDGIPAYLDPDERPATGGGSPVTTTGNSTTNNGGSGAQTNGGVGSSTGSNGGTFTTGSVSLQDAGTDDLDGGGPIVGITKAKVMCNETECETTGGFTCCEHWTTSGFEEPECVPAAQCSPLAPSYRSAYEMENECDGPEDCGTGSVNDPNVCCFLLQSAPRWPWDPSAGPGLGRECMAASDCFGDQGPTFAQGIPQGIASCNDDDDCSVHQGSWSCQAEEATDATAGGVAPRPWVKLCK